ncbi:hypothetical protein FRC10_003618 [Ceratobasidium sp. 414]|nr:hypothetical protein FRC10_003618 [Ceratobasidium sp. 414]
MSAPSTPPAKRFSFRSPTRAFTLTSPARPASPTTTGPNGRPVPSRSNTRDSVSTTGKTRSILTSAFAPRKSGLGSSAAPSSDAVHEVGVPKTEEPVAVETTEPAKDEPKEAAPVEHTPGHVRARSGSTVSTRSSQAGPLTPPPPTQVAEPVAIPKANADPVSDSPHDGASVASSRSPSRLRRQISNLSRRSGSIRRLSLLGPGTASPPAVETTPAVGEVETRSRSPSISDMHRLAASPEPVPVTSAEPVTSDPDLISKEPVASEPAEPAPQPVAPVEALVEAPVEAPVEVPVEAPQVTAAEAPVEAPVEAPAAAPVETLVPAAPAPAPAEVAAPAPVEVIAPAPAETPKPAEPQTPSKLKPSMSHNASTASLTKSPDPAEKPKPRRRDTLTNWARRSLDRKPSGNDPTLARPPSRGALSGDDSDTDSLKERERGWNTGRTVPSVPEPKKSDDNLKRRFSLGRRSSTGHAKTPSDSASESDKKPNWAAKVLRVGSKSKKDKGDAASSTTDVTGTDATPEPLSIPESRPSLTIPGNMAMDQRPLSAIVESPISPGVLQSAALVIAGPSPLANAITATSDSPVDVKPEDSHSEPEIVEAPVEAPAEPVPEPTVVALASPEPLPDDANPMETTVAPVEPAPATEEVQPEVQPEVAEEAQPKDASGTATPAQAEANGTAAPPEDALSPMSPNSPSSTPWDPVSQREIVPARSPHRTSVGGPSNRSRAPSPAQSIIGVKRKQPDEPEVARSRVRYLPDWAISPAIQLAVTLSLVLPRRRRDAANPSNRRRGWWPLRRSGPRTELRYNAIRGVNEEVPIVSRSWTLPAVARTTAKVVTAPARWMYRLFVPRSSVSSAPSVPSAN